MEQEYSGFSFLFRSALLAAAACSFSSISRLATPFCLFGTAAAAVVAASFFSLSRSFSSRLSLSLYLCARPGSSFAVFAVDCSCEKRILQPKLLCICISTVHATAAASAGDGILDEPSLSLVVS